MRHARNQVNFVKEQLASGIAQPSFVARELEHPSFPNDEWLNWTAKSLYVGGADTVCTQK
ncbi:hypothetical protein DL96DRAFT_754588 [Flagelloscypha sp. PMI_526]|nr:hypothetical protein DL96DRAFT_754588 [Flagelloscypha sp. PMI_526]